MNEASSIETHLREDYKVTETDNHASDALAVDFKHDLHRGLKSRQIAMVVKLKTPACWFMQIAIGGAIGTGLIIGTGGKYYITCS